MNSYRFTLSYDNNRDARDASKTLAAYLMQEGSPISATVRYNGPKVEFTVGGNMSAASLVVALEDFGAVYKVEPVGDSAPLPRIYMMA